MSDDFADFDDTFDSAIFNELDAIEASQFARSATQATTSTYAPNPSTGRPNVSNTHRNIAGPSSSRASSSCAPTVLETRHFAPPPPPAHSRKVTQPDSDDFDMTFNIDEADLAKIDQHVEDVLAGRAIAGPSKSTTQLLQTVQARAGPSRSRQTTLDGAFSPSKEARTFNRARSFNRINSNKARPEKKWDRTAFSATSWMFQKKMERQKEASRAAEKNNANPDIEDEVDEDEDLGFEQFPNPESLSTFRMFLSTREGYLLLLFQLGMFCIFLITINF